MTAKISILTTCTITLVTALTNLTPLEVRAMEGANFDGYYDHSTKAQEMIQNNGCFWIPIIGLICPGGSNNSDDD